MSKMPNTRKDQPTSTATMKMVMCGHTKPTMPAPIQITPKMIRGHRWRAARRPPMSSRRPPAMKNPLAR